MTHPEAGQGIRELEQLTGARITIHRAAGEPEEGEVRVSLSGSAEQVEAGRAAVEQACRRLSSGGMEVNVKALRTMLRDDATMRQVEQSSGARVQVRQVAHVVVFGVCARVFNECFHVAIELCFDL